MSHSENTNGRVSFVYSQNSCDFPVSLAMSYVPWQKWETLFDESAALKRGTAFPSLELPFLGKEVQR